MVKIAPRQISGAKEQSKPIGVTGTAEFPSAVVGDYHVTLTRWTGDGLMSDDRPLAEQVVAVEPGKTAVVRFGADAGSLTGKVFPARPGTILTVIDPRHDPYPWMSHQYRCETEGGNSYRFPALPSGSWQIRAQPQSNDASHLAIQTRVGQVSIVRGKELVRDLQIPSSRIAGRVVDTEGRGLSGVPIMVDSTANQIAGGNQKTLHSGGDGEFQLSGLPAGSVFLSAYDPERGSAPRREIPIQGTDQTVDGVELKLTKGGGSLRLRVLDHDSGQSIPAATVMLIHSVNTLYTPEPPRGADGSWIFGNLETGEYELQLQVPGYAHVRPKVRVAGSGETVLDVKLHPAATLRWRIKAQPPVDLSGVRNSVISEGGDHWFPQITRSATEIMVTVNQLPPGPLTLKSERPDKDPQIETVEIRAGQTTEVETEIQP
jgi:hypothetical protein